MSIDATCVERRNMPDRRTVERRKQIERVREPVKHGLLFCCLSTFLVACIGFIVFKALGLYDAMDSTLAKVVVGGGISWYFVACFRHGLYRCRR